MPGWVAELLRLLRLVAERIRLVRRKREQEEYQDEVERLQEDPVGYGRDHFNRVRDPAEMPGDADSSGKTNTAQLDHKRTGRSEP